MGTPSKLIDNVLNKEPLDPLLHPILLQAGGEQEAVEMSQAGVKIV